MDRLRVLRVLSDTTDLSLGQALSVADQLHAEFDKPRPKKYDFSTHEGRVAYARTLPDVMDYLPNRKIQAIKNLRDHLRGIDAAFPYAGLKECKDVCDAISPPPPF